MQKPCRSGCGPITHQLMKPPYSDTRRLQKNCFACVLPLIPNERRSGARKGCRNVCDGLATLVLGVRPPPCATRVNYTFLRLVKILEQTSQPFIGCRVGQRVEWRRELPAPRRPTAARPSCGGITGPSPSFQALATLAAYRKPAKGRMPQGNLRAAIASGAGEYPGRVRSGQFPKEGNPRGLVRRAAAGLRFPRPWPG
jgi:hypothetical protein